MKRVLYLTETPVPEGHATIAQRFNVGDPPAGHFSPEGTAESTAAHAPANPLSLEKHRITYQTR